MKDTITFIIISLLIMSGDGIADLIFGTLPM